MGCDFHENGKVESILLYGTCTTLNFISLAIGFRPESRWTCYILFSWKNNFALHVALKFIDRTVAART